MTTAAQGDEPGNRPLTHVGTLIRKYGNGRSIRQIERDNGLNNGQLSRYANPEWDGNEMSLPILNRFATALGAPMEEVSAAFAKDVEIPLEGRKLRRDEEELLDAYALVPNEYRSVVHRMIKAACEEVAAKQNTQATPIPPRT
jgi:hypothetical protein